MSTLRFRAWDKKEKEMHFSERDADIGFWKWVSYDSDTPIMQSTGLLDKQGKEIFKGDIVSFEDTESTYVDVGVGDGMKVAETKLNSWGTVIFEPGMFGLECPKTEVLEKSGFNSFESIKNWIGCEDLEIIGNIYQNPELLK